MKRITALLAITLLFSSCTLAKNVPKEEFIVDSASPNIPVGVVDIQFGKITGLKKSPVNIIYYPLEDAVCLQYRYNFITYNQYWSVNGRYAFIKALEKYNEDYEARNLAKGSRKKTMRTYNTVLGYLSWRMAAFTVNAKANMKLEIGYSFHEKSPFFTVNQREADYKDPITRGNDRSSKPITLFFTRAQAQELADYFDQEFLQSLIPDEMNRRNLLYNFDEY